jgi:hypothetical protein
VGSNVNSSRDEPLTRYQIKRILKKHYGSAVWVAGQLGVSKNVLSNWLSGRRQKSRLFTHEQASEQAIAVRERAESLGGRWLSPDGIDGPSARSVIEKLRGGKGKP